MGVTMVKRRQGAIGAMVDEYERAAVELGALVSGLTDAEYLAARDLETEDEDCRSIQSVMRHVIRAGYGYAADIRTALGNPTQRRKIEPPARADVPRLLREVIAHTDETFDGKWLMDYKNMTQVQMDVPWGVRYDLEQLLEHAIVHVLRHRRQIERFLSEPQFRPK
jgi:uncharacterized damage-inducible protein DinB